jgi:hypothetical protein
MNGFISKSKVLFYLVLISIFSSSYLKEVYPQMNDNDSSMKERDFYIDIIVSFKPEKFYQLDKNDTEPLKAIFNSIAWTKKLFKKECVPDHIVEKTNLEYHASTSDIYDLMKYDFSCGEYKATIYESSAFLVFESTVRIPDGYKIDDVLRSAELLTSTVCNLETNIVFKVEESHPQYQCFTSNPDLSTFQIKEWSDKIDGFFKDCKIYLIFYKVDMERFDFGIDPFKWFDDESRKKLESMK